MGGVHPRAKGERPVPKKPREWRNIQHLGPRRGVGGLTDLPAGFIGKSADLHAMRSAARPGGGVAIIVESTRLTVAVASGELDSQALTHEVGSIF